MPEIRQLVLVAKPPADLYYLYKNDLAVVQFLHRYLERKIVGIQAGILRIQKSYHFPVVMHEVYYLLIGRWYT